eukprot:5299064-Pleurochrysis_carterae.AAC.1
MFDDYSVGTSNPRVKPLQSSRTTEKAIRTGSIQGMSRQKIHVPDAVGIMPCSASSCSAPCERTARYCIAYYSVHKNIAYRCRIVLSAFRMTVYSNVVARVANRVEATTLLVASPPHR